MNGKRSEMIKALKLAGWQKLRLCPCDGGELCWFHPKITKPGCYVTLERAFARIKGAVAELGRRAGV